MFLENFAKNVDRNILITTKQKIEEMFPIEDSNRILTYETIDIKIPPEAFDPSKFSEIADKGGDIAMNVNMNLVLKDKKTNKVIDKDTIRLKIPIMNIKGTFMVKGNEYILPTQLRLKPGIYTRAKENGELVAEFKMEKGENFKIILDPINKKLRLDNGRQIKLIPLLKGLGVTEAEMKRAWGDSAFGELNAADGSGDPEKEVTKFMERSFSKRYQWLWGDIPNDLPPSEKVRAYLNKTELDPNITEITMEKPYSKVDIQTMLDAVKQLILIANEEKKPSGMSSVVFKKANKPIHFIEEKLEDMKKILNSSVKPRISRFDEIKKIISPSYTQKIFDDFFLTSSVSQLSDQPNPLGLLSNLGKVVLTGEGAIEEDRAITEIDRSLDPYHFAFIDPVHTPESEKIGSNLYATIGALNSIYGNKDKELKNTFYDLKEKKRKQLSPVEVYNKVLAFPGEIKDFKPTGKIVKAIHKGKIKNVKDTEVDLVLPTAADMFDISSNTIPFLQSINGNRAMMASKHLTHAIPLKEPEQPLVQTKVPEKQLTFEQMVGSTNTINSPVDGTVTKITNNKIYIKDTFGKIHEIGMIDYLQTGENTFLKNIPVVKVGDKVKKGDLLAESNITKNGTLALGRNLKVAYVPYKGFNYEDGIVISDTAAKKLASEHLRNFKIEILPGTILNKEKFRAYFPQNYTMTQLNKLDNRGIIKEGEKVRYGDPIAVVLRERGQSLQEQLIGDLHKQLMSPVKNDSIEWDRDVEGEVVKVIKSPSSIQVKVKSVEPVIPGDKIVGRHGNKGTVAQVIPESEMPRDEKGEPVEVLMNPAGIPSRINPSQLLETAAGKIAVATGKPYLVENFADDNYLDKILNELKRLNLKEKEYLTDPALGKLEKPVTTGYQYIVKLPQQVNEKTNIREEWGYDADKRPLRGGQEGGGARALDPLTTYALIAHDARANMREMATYKAEKNDEFWAAVQNGQIPPAPKPTFAFNKFVGYLKGAGINVEKSGNYLKLSPMKDKDIISMSSGEIKTPDTLKGYNLTPEKDGLFDVNKLGGLQGSKWGHITLAKPILNPTFETQVKKILDINSRDFKALLDGQKGVDELGNIVPEKQAKYFGGEAFKKLLEKVDIDKELKKIRTQLEKEDQLKPEEVEQLLDKAKLLRGLKETKTKPTDFVISTLPVLPPQYRPIYPSQDEKFMVVSPINYLYKDTILLNNQIKEVEKNKLITPEEEKKLISELYKQTKALVGTGSPLPFTQSAKEGASGALEFIAGKGSPKQGYFQSKVLNKRQELSSNLVIQNGPDLSLDEAALPEEAAWNLYKPFLIKRLQNNGYNIKEAQDLIKKRDPVARKALEEELNSRPVILNRSPSLHKFSVMSFKPVLTKDKVLRLNPLIVKGFNADFDGDSTINSVYCRILNLDTLTKEQKAFLFEKENNTTSKYFEGIINLEDFPRIEESLVEKRNKEIYDVPAGVEILSHKNGKTSFMPVQKYSIHKNLTMLRITTTSQRNIFCSLDHSLVTLDDKLNYVSAKPRINLAIPRLKNIYNSIPINDNVIVPEALTPDGDLPFGWEQTSYEFRKKLLFNVLELNNPKIRKKLYRREQFPKTTFSRRAAFEIVALSESLGLVASLELISKLDQPEEWLITFSQKSIDNIKKMLRGEKCEPVAETVIYTPPLSDKRLKELRKAIGAPRVRDDLNLPVNLPIEEKERRREIRKLYMKCTYAMQKKAPLDKETALEIFKLDLDIFQKEFWKKWKEMVLDDNVIWEIIEEIEHVPQITKAYDLTSSPNFTMVTESGFVIQDTMAVHIPVTEEARQEALRMTPSKNLFKPGDNSLMNTLRLEYNGGIYNLTEPPQSQKVKDTNARSYSELFNELYSNKLKYNDLIKFNGKVSTVGRHLVNELFPEKYRNYDIRWDAKKINSVIEQIAKENSDKAVDILNKLKELSRFGMYKVPFSAGLSDLTLQEANVFKEKIKKIDMANVPEQEKIKKMEEIDQEISEFLNSESKDLADKNAFLMMKDSGTKGSTAQIKQLLIGPVSVQNNFGETIPVPIGKSYGEGLTPSQYFSASFGARMGMLAKKMGVSEPGALNKEILNSVADQIITEIDNPDDPGVPYDITMTDDNDLIGRILSKDVIDNSGKVIAKKGETITPKLLSLIKNARRRYIYLKSPLTDPTPEGMSAAAFGIDETGRLPSIGTNIGVKNTQSITEPLSQGALNFFHTGGVSSTKSSMSAYEAINTMTKLTSNFKATSAVLSQVTGNVQKIKRQPLGGYVVTVDGVRHIIPPGLRPKVQEGDKIKKGQPLSTGVVHPENAYQARGMNYARQTMANQFKSALKGTINVNSSTVETLVRGLTSHVQITNPGPFRDRFDIGDVVQGQYIDFLNRQATLTKKPVNDNLIGWMVGDNYEDITVGTPIDRNILKELQELGLKEIMAYKEVIKYKPIIKGTTVLPRKKSDWLHKATFRGLKRDLPEEAVRGGKANIHGTSPLTAWVYGAEIRRDEKGRY